MGAETTRPVLVVEDDHIDAEYILKTLSKFDITTEVYPRSYEAISYLQRTDVPKPVLVLLDWKISGGGATVLRAVRETPSIATIPVVILSRSTAHADVRAAMAGHANAFVAKAGELHDFQGQVTAICEFFLNIAQPPPSYDTELDERLGERQPSERGPL
jgi:CheY-like chemotaxis protein